MIEYLFIVITKIMVGFFGSLRKKKLKEKELKTENSESESDNKLEFKNSKIDLSKLVSEIKNFLEKNDNPFDYTTHDTLELPENNGVCFKIEYGIKNPTFTFYITLEQFENNLKIFDHIPANYSSLAEMGTLPVLNLQKSFNSRAYRIKLWNFIEKTAKSLEN